MKVTLRQRKKDTNRISLYLEFYDKGTRKYEYLNMHLQEKPKTSLERQHNKEKLQIAEGIRSKRELDWLNGMQGFVNSEKRNLNFIEYFSRLVNGRLKTGINADTWKSAQKHLVEYTGGVLRFDELNDLWLENYKQYLISKVSQNTVHAYFNKVKAAIHDAHKNRVIIDNPAARVSTPKLLDTERVFLTEQEFKAIAQTECKYPVLKRAFLFSVLSGLRWSDIQKLTWKEVQDTNEGSRIQFTQAKTKGVEYLPITAQARQLLGSTGERDERVFVGLKYSSYTNVALKQWAVNAGIIKDITFHSARHTYATLLLTKGADIYTISKLLGHRELRTTQIYAHMIDKKKEEAIEKLPLIEI